MSEDKAVVDSAEPWQAREYMKQKSGGVFDWSQEKLPTGDYVYPAESVVIERKEASDFASSLTDGRLSEQADRMCEEFDYQYIILEGSPYKLQYSDVAENSLMGMMSSLAVKRGIPVLFTETRDQTLWLVNRIFERHRGGEAGQGGSHVKTFDAGEVDDLELAMLMQIPGVTESKANEIVDTYGGFHRLSGRAHEPKQFKNDLMRIDGVGSKTASKIVNLFLSEREEL